MQGRKSRAKLYALMGAIWFVITLPLPFLFDADVPEGQLYTILGIVGIMSVPFVVLGVVWSLKPELTREGHGD